MKTLLVLSIVLPVGILSTLRLTGIFQGSSTKLESIVMETKELEFERPTESISINDQLNSTCLSDGLSSIFCVVVGTYGENQTAYLGSDYLTMAIRMNSTVANTNAFIRSFSVVLHKDSTLSQIDWLNTHVNPANLSVTSIANSGSGSTDAYIRLAGVNNPREVHFSSTVVWSFSTPNEQTQSLGITYELTYGNGIAYAKIVQAFRLVVVGS
jgi:hypothetical protein